MSFLLIVAVNILYFQLFKKILGYKYIINKLKLH